MRWRKLGLVYTPPGDRTWARQYAHLPTPVVWDDRTIRVYFAGLDAEKYGRVGYVDVDATDPTRVLAESPEPVLDLGPPGTFDDSGVNPSCLVRVGDRWRMYYIGWQRSRRVPYLLFAGAAESADGERFERVSRAPVLDRTDAEPFLRSATSVLPTGGGYRAWYVSATGWTKANGEPYPRYVVRTADSVDGLTWSAGGSVCIDLEGDEFGIGRPWVVARPRPVPHVVLDPVSLAAVPDRVRGVGGRAAVAAAGRPGRDRGVRGGLGRGDGVLCRRDRRRRSAADVLQRQPPRRDRVRRGRAGAGLKA